VYFSSSFIFILFYVGAKLALFPLGMNIFRGRWKQGAEENSSVWTKERGVTEGWGKLHSKEFNNMSSLTNIIRVIR
jgi:hypothetical protein